MPNIEKDLKITATIAWFVRSLLIANRAHVSVIATNERFVAKRVGKADIQLQF